MKPETGFLLGASFGGFFGTAWGLYVLKFPLWCGLASIVWMFFALGLAAWIQDSNKEAKP